MSIRTPSSTTPSHWPSELKYLTCQCYHSSVSENIRSQLFRADKGSSTSITTGGQHTARPPVVIRRITEDHHPAKGQYGLYATKRIQPRCHIIDYVGEVHCDDRPESDYDLSLLRLPDGQSVGVDASRMGNEARFINDFRGVAKKPNAQLQESRNEKAELCMSVWSSSETIKKGDEILLSYGKGFWKARTEVTD